MKILFTQKITGISGAEKYYFKLFSKIREKGVVPVFLAIVPRAEIKKAGKFREEIEKLNVRYDEIIIDKDLSFSLLKKLKQYIDSNDFDIVQSNLIHADLWFGLTKIFSKKKFKLLSVKHGYNEKYFNQYGIQSKHISFDAFWWISFIAERFIDHSVSISEGLKTLLINLKISDPNKIETVYYGFNFEEKNYDQKPSKKILILGRLSLCKGLSEALNAFKIVLQEKPEYLLQFVGSGPLKEDLIKEAKDLNIQDNVEFTGFVSNVDDYIQEAEIMLISTKSEGFGMVFVEAVINKTAIVAFDVPAGNEIVRHHKTALLAKPFDVNELAAHMLKLIDDKSLREKLIDSAYREVSKKFVLQNMIDETYEVYRKILKE